MFNFFKKKEKEYLFEVTYYDEVKCEYIKKKYDTAYQVSDDFKGYKRELEVTIRPLSKGVYFRDKNARLIQLYIGDTLVCTLDDLIKFNCH